MTSLTAITCLSGVPPEVLQAASTLWKRRSVPRGTLLWKEDELSCGLALLLDGELEARCGGWEVGRIHQGQILGEVSAFHDYARRTATVKATRDSEVVQVSVSSLRLLRRIGSPIYAALLDEALSSVARRVRRADQEIARRMRGSEGRPHRQAPRPPLRRLLRAEPHPPGDLPSPVDLLRAIPGQERLADAGAWSPRHVPEGDCLFMEGDRSREVWLIAKGNAEVLRMTGGTALHLADRGRGALVGTNAAVDPAPRCATLRATEDLWAWTRRLDEGISPALAEALLYSLAEQVIVANVALSEARRAELQPTRRAPPPPRAERRRGRDPETGLDLDALDAALREAAESLSA